MDEFAGHEQHVAPSHWQMSNGGDVAPLNDAQLDANELAGNVFGAENETKRVKVEHTGSNTHSGQFGDVAVSHACDEEAVMSSSMACSDFYSSYTAATSSVQREEEGEEGNGRANSNVAQDAVKYEVGTEFRPPAKVNSAKKKAKKEQSSKSKKNPSKKGSDKGSKKRAKVLELPSWYNPMLALKPEPGQEVHHPRVRALEGDEVILYSSNANLAALIPPSCVTCGGFEEQSDLLCCCNCAQHFHRFCLGMRSRPEDAETGKWRCPACKSCEVCKSSSHDDCVLVCDKCDRGFHTFCLDPPLGFIPIGDWLCPEHGNCVSCGAHRAGDTPFHVWHDNDTLCHVCWSRIRDNNQCPSCLRAFDPDEWDCAFMVGCDCGRWVHRGCDGISPEIYELLNAPDQRFANEPYFCVVCRASGKSQTQFVSEELQSLVTPEPTKVEEAAPATAQAAATAVAADTVPTVVVETLKCALCHKAPNAQLLGRMLPVPRQIDTWVHSGCALWAKDVLAHRTCKIEGIQDCLVMSRGYNCALCGMGGGSVQCRSRGCCKRYHFSCVRMSEHCGVVLLKPGLAFCPDHASEANGMVAVVDGVTVALPGLGSSSSKAAKGSKKGSKLSGNAAVVTAPAPAPGPPPALEIGQVPEIVDSAAVAAAAASGSSTETPRPALPTFVLVGLGYPYLFLDHDEVASVATKKMEPRRIEQSWEDKFKAFIAKNPSAFLNQQYEQKESRNGDGAYMSFKRMAEAVAQNVVMQRGGLMVTSFGQVCLDPRFHTKSLIFPVGFRAVRRFWSYVTPQQLTWYDCRIGVDPVEGAPEFLIRAHDDYRGGTGAEEEARTIRAASPEAAWSELLKRFPSDGAEPRVFCDAMMCEEMFGFAPWVVAAIEAMKGARSCANYTFQFWNRAITIALGGQLDHPRGCARGIPFSRNGESGFRKEGDTFVYSNVVAPRAVANKPGAKGKAVRKVGRRVVGEPQEGNRSDAGASSAAAYVSFVDEPRSAAMGEEDGAAILSEALLNRQNMTETPDFVRLRQLQLHPPQLVVHKSRIHGMGVYTLTPIRRNDMVIEYMGEIIRPLVADRREKEYERQNIPCYLWKLDEHRIVDATFCGNMARFINHCHDPNCAVDIVTVGGIPRVMVSAKRDILAGEELSYDYCFDSDEAKLKCECGATNCPGFMDLPPLN